MHPSNTGQSPPGSQFPGISDDQIGTEDFDRNDYPWQQQAARSTPNTHATHARAHADDHAHPHPHPHAHPMRMEPNENPDSNNSPDSAASVAPATPTPQVHVSMPYQTVTPQHPQPPQHHHNPAQAYGNPPMPPMPSGRWVFLPDQPGQGKPYPPGHHQLPSIPSLDLARYSTGSWNMGLQPVPPVPQAVPHGSWPLQPAQPLSSLPPAPGVSPVPHGQSAANSPRVQPEERPQNGHEHKHEHENGEFDPFCEFSHPCNMSPSPDGTHYRKIVSHLFGRNKASTKLFPQSVWVYYCRKHYQRARYRAQQWPFEQCELLHQSLNRMQQWGYVQSFELRLRRREALRSDGQGERPAPSGLLENGRRHPTAITAPVPDWLQREVGAGKTFDDVRDLLNRIEAYLQGIQKQEDEKKVEKNETCGEKNSLVRFPDIEILPTFHPEVLEDAKRRTASKKAGQNKKKQEDENGVEGVVEERDLFSEGEDLVAETANQLKRRKKAKKEGRRVSSRGSIKKPTKKEK